MASDPYCSNCGYSLKGLTESSKCPECGKPLVEVLTRRLFDPSKVGWGKRYRSAITLFGLPLLHIASGPAEDGPKGKARGIVAIGDEARGVLAVGGGAVGVVAIGGLARGFFAMGGLAIGVFSLGGWSTALMAWGGGSVGLLAFGGGTSGVIATGGGAIGYYAAGGGVLGKYVIAPYRRDAEAEALFSKLTWLLGTTPAGSAFKPLAWMIGVWFLLLLLIGGLMLWGYLKHEEEEPHGKPGTG